MNKKDWIIYIVVISLAIGFTGGYFFDDIFLNKAEVETYKEIIQKDEIKFEYKFIIYENKTSSLQNDIDKDIIFENVEENPKYIISDDEREMLAILVFLEGGIETYECKKGIVSVIFNRLDNNFLNSETLEDVVYAKNQFSPSYLIKDTIPYVCEDKEYEKTKEFIDRWNSCFASVDEILKNGSMFPEYVMYFRSGYHFKWNDYSGHCKIGNIYFGFMNEDKINYEGR